MLVPQSAQGLTGYLSVISASLTPAILILATGSLVASTLQRLSRIVDRARVLVTQIEEARAKDEHDERARLNAMWLRTYLRRSTLTERALSFYYIAIGLFVASSLAITVEDITSGRQPWIALLLVTAGALFLFAGTAALVIETQIATGILRAEIEASCENILPPTHPLPASLVRFFGSKRSP